jgi:hypothetical protein
MLGIQPHHLQQLGDPPADLALGQISQPQRLSDDPPDPHAGVQRSVGILKHDLEMAAQRPHR